MCFHVAPVKRKRPHMAIMFTPFELCLHETFAFTTFSMLKSSYTLTNDTLLIIKCSNPFYCTEKLKDMNLSLKGLRCYIHLSSVAPGSLLIQQNSLEYLSIHLMNSPVPSILSRMFFMHSKVLITFRGKVVLIVSRIVFIRGTWVILFSEDCIVIKEFKRTSCMSQRCMFYINEHN